MSPTGPPIAAPATACPTVLPMMPPGFNKIRYQTAHCPFSPSRVSCRTLELFYLRFHALFHHCHFHLFCAKDDVFLSNLGLKLFDLCCHSPYKLGYVLFFRP